eukprot:scaffold2928_cov79-Cylindrotheca_fusiformis.AAC.2
MAILSLLGVCCHCHEEGWKVGCLLEKSLSYIEGKIQGKILNGQSEYNLSNKTSVVRPRSHDQDHTRHTTTSWEEKYRPRCQEIEGKETASLKGEYLLSWLNPNIWGIRLQSYHSRVGFMSY